MSIVDVYTFLARGGWLMIPIVACSVAGLAFFLERVWQLRRSQVLPTDSVEQLFERLEAGDFGAAGELCDDLESPIGPMVAAALDRPDDDRRTLKERVEEVGQREVFHLERFVDALGAIATVSPLLGLLGTVVGMIDVFREVVQQSAQGGPAQAAVLAQGIWQALITTASGLTVAIPVYLGYRFLLSRIDGYAVELEDLGVRAVELISGRRRAKGESAEDAVSDDGDASDTPEERTGEEAA